MNNQNKISIVIACSILFVCVNLFSEDISPPVAAKKPKVIRVQGDEIVDNYYWLREKTNPEVLEYLKAENAYAEKMLAHTKGLQEKLYNEMVSRIKETDLSVPVKYGEYFYYNKTEKGKQYPIFFRKKGSLQAAEETLIDLNELAKGKKFMALGNFEVSDDGNLLAYSTDDRFPRLQSLRQRFA